jgi:hypothetical protein
MGMTISAFNSAHCRFVLLQAHLVWLRQMAYEEMPTLLTAVADVMSVQPVDVWPLFAPHAGWSIND